jgi:hypothetical protein
VNDLVKRADLLRLARHAAIPGWWAGFDEAIPKWFEPYLGLENIAKVIRSYDFCLVPALLQSENYARAAIALEIGLRAAAARGRASLQKAEADLEFRLALRLRRQHRLFGERPPKLWAIIDEAALLRLVGGRATMFHQLEYLAELSELPGISIQILPLSNAWPTMAGGPVTLLSPPLEDLMDVVYLEQLHTGHYLSNPRDIECYRFLLNTLASQAERPLDAPQILQGIMRGL